MFKKLALTGIIFAAASSLVLADTSYHPHHYRKMSYKGENNFAPPPPAPPSYAHFSFGGGPYVGFDLGLRTNYTSNPAAYKGVEGTLLAGYGILMRSGFYIAEEIFASAGAQLQSYSSSSEAAKSSWSGGLSILPGYLILDNVIAYGRLGVVKTYFSNAGGNANGGQLGLGLQMALNSNWDLRGEYIYSFYSTVGGGCGSASMGDLGAVKSDQFNVGLVYKIM